MPADLEQLPAAQLPPVDPPDEEWGGDDDGGGDDHRDDRGDWLTIATFWTAPEAHVARLKLESREIDCYLLDENLIATDWLIANAAGGIKLQVRRSDAAAAAALLARHGGRVPPGGSWDDIAAVQPLLPGACPACGSHDVYRESIWRTTGVVLTAMVLLSFGFLLLPLLPWLLKKPRPWTCIDCGQQFPDTRTGGFPVSQPSDQP